MLGLQLCFCCTLCLCHLLMDSMFSICTVYSLYPQEQHDTTRGKQMVSTEQFWDRIAGQDSGSYKILKFLKVFISAN